VRKSYTWFLFAISFGLATQPILSVHAATTTVGDAVPAAATSSPADSKQSTASFTVVAGDLSLASVPDLRFKTIKSHDVESGTVTAVQADNAAGNQDANLQVNDFSGTAAGWSVTASLSNFVSGTASLNGVSLNLLGSPSSGTPAFSQVTLPSGGGAVKVWSATAGSGMGINTADFSGTTKQSQLVIPQQTKVVTDQPYTATINWVIQNAP